MSLPTGAGRVVTQRSGRCGPTRHHLLTRRFLASAATLSPGSDTHLSHTSRGTDD